MEIYKGSHSVYRLQYHVVWVCKYRRRVLKPNMCSYLHRILPTLMRSMPGVVMEAIGFDKDHIHMVLVIPPRYSISSVMGQLKSQSASRMRKTYPWLKKVYWNENVLWSPGYFVSSVGLNEELIRSYVEHQGREDSGQLRMKL